VAAHGSRARKEEKKKDSHRVGIAGIEMRRNKEARGEWKRGETGCGPRNGRGLRGLTRRSHAVSHAED